LIVGIISPKNEKEPLSLKVFNDFLRNIDTDGTASNIHSNVEEFRFSAAINIKTTSENSNDATRKEK